MKMASSVCRDGGHGGTVTGVDMKASTAGHFPGASWKPSRHSDTSSAPDRRVSITHLFVSRPNHVVLELARLLLFILTHFSCPCSYGYNPISLGVTSKVMSYVDARLTVALLSSFVTAANIGCWLNLHDVVDPAAAHMASGRKLASVKRVTSK